MAKQESHEDFMKSCFGDDFWDKPEEERFDMIMNRVLRMDKPSTQQAEEVEVDEYQ